MLILPNYKVSFLEVINLHFPFCWVASWWVRSWTGRRRCCLRWRLQPGMCSPAETNDQYDTLLNMRLCYQWWEMWWFRTQRFCTSDSDFYSSGHADYPIDTLQSKQTSMRWKQAWMQKIFVFFLFWFWILLN